MAEHDASRDHAAHHILQAQLGLKELYQFAIDILGPDASFYKLAIVYGVAISLLTLAIPISVQTLINTVANTALVAPLVTLAVILFIVLAVSGCLYALRLHLLEVFERRVFARLSADIALRAVHGKNHFFEDVDRRDLFNRYFDIMTLQKNVSQLLMDGFTLVLQTVVGFAVVSFYHPYFLAFNIIFLLVIYMIFRIWGKAAIFTAIERSHAKYAVAHWLEELSSSHAFFKGERNADHALRTTDQLSAKYVHAHRRHFRNTFAQSVAFLFIYALASAVLLGVGGWLVVQAQLTLGQLVAAELILSAIFFGVSQFGTELKVFYDAVAAIEELSLIRGIPLEKRETHAVRRPDTGLIQFHNATQEVRGRAVRFNVELPARTKAIAQAITSPVQRMFIDMLHRHAEPTAGWLSVGGEDVAACDLFKLRQDVLVLDRPTILQCSIEEYLQLADPSASRTEIRHVLEVAGLAAVVDRLPEGVETGLQFSGRPLSARETMRLKLAAAMLQCPDVLVLTQHFDLLEADDMRRIMETFCGREEQTVIYFSDRYFLPMAMDMGFHHFLGVDYEYQSLHSSYADAVADPLFARLQGIPISVPSAGSAPATVTA